MTAQAGMLPGGLEGDATFRSAAVNETTFVLLGEADSHIDEFVLTHPHGQIYYRPSFLRFLCVLSDQISTGYLVCQNRDKIEGLFPVAVCESEGRYILNSLPFFGSHGGALIRPGPRRDHVAAALQTQFCSLLNARRIDAYTVVQNLFSENLGSAFNEFTYHNEERLGQVTPLQPGWTTIEQLLAAFHQKTRNAARKALKSGFGIKRVRLADALEQLQRTHALNMAQIGGRTKPLDVFAKLDSALGASSTSCYIASKNGRPAAYLLLLYSGDTVEYFTPAIVDEFKSEQPLTALIVEAMMDAATSGYRRWNWGGTWPSQEGVYRFKSRFGACDYPYRYQIGVRDLGLCRESKEQLAAAFPYFFVLPYSALD
jgi:hypothetical protein